MCYLLFISKEPNSADAPSAIATLWALRVLLGKLQFLKRKQFRIAEGSKLTIAEGSKLTIRKQLRKEPKHLPVEKILSLGSQEAGSMCMFRIHTGERSLWLFMGLITCTVPWARPEYTCRKRNRNCMSFSTVLAVHRHGPGWNTVAGKKTVAI